MYNYYQSLQIHLLWFHENFLQVRPSSWSGIMVLPIDLTFFLLYVRLIFHVQQSNIVMR